MPYGINKQKEKLQVLTLLSYVFYFVTALYFHNCEQNLGNNVKKSSKIGQDKKILKSAIA